MKLSIIIFTIFVSRAFGYPPPFDFLGELQNKGSDGSGKAFELIPKGGLDALFGKVLSSDNPLRGIATVVGAKDGGALQILKNVIRSVIAAIRNGIENGLEHVTRSTYFTIGDGNPAAKTQGGKESIGNFDIRQILGLGNKGQGNDGSEILYRTRNGNRFEDANSANGKNGGDGSRESWASVKDENDNQSPGRVKNEKSWKNVEEKGKENNEERRGHANESNKKGREDGEDNRSSSNRSYDRSDSGREENEDKHRRGSKKIGEWGEGLKSDRGKGEEREDYNEGGKGENGERDNEGGKSENRKGYNDGGKGERREEYNEGGKAENHEGYHNGRYEK